MYLRRAESNSDSALLYAPTVGKETSPVPGDIPEPAMRFAVIRWKLLGMDMGRIEAHQLQFLMDGILTGGLTANPLRRILGHF